MSNVVIQTIQARVSSPKLIEPGPTPEQLDDILKCALRAPDHARLKPWKFWIIQGIQRNELGKLFVKACLNKYPESSVDKINKTQNMPLRSPMIIVATCEPVSTLKVPNFEQDLAVAAAVQNMQIAISSLGLGSIWRTGELAEAPIVKEAFELSPNGKIIGFIYIGTPEKTLPSQAIDTKDFIQKWMVPASED